jgi:phosphate:Na+ symporter
LALLYTADKKEIKGFCRTEAFRAKKFLGILDEGNWRILNSKRGKPVIGSILEIAGGLAVFIYGMKVMSDGIQKAAGERLHSIMNFMTGNRFAGVLTGFLITAIIQSSSATTVMVVSFVNAGLLSLSQAIGVILGANIGTTVTGWIVALVGFKVNITAMALPAVALGLVLFLVRKLRKRDWGEALIGFGLLFLGLQFLKNSVPDIRGNPEVLQFLTRYTDLGILSYVIFVLAGTLLTIIVQSSSAAMAITLTMAYAGWIDFPTAAAIVLGENIGTTVTAYIASIGTRVNARRAARVHLLFNVAGVIWMAFLFRPFLRLIDLIVPGDVLGSDGITSHLAMFHTMFNICNVAVFIGLVPYLAKAVEFLIRDRKGEREKVYRLKYVATGIQDTPEINIMNAEKEIIHMAEVVEEMFSVFRDVFTHPKTKMADEVEHLEEMEDYTDQMQEELSRYLVECLKENLNETSANNVNAMIRIVDELESVADSCYNLIILAQRRYDKKILFPEKAWGELEAYTEAVVAFLEYNRNFLHQHGDEIDLEKAYELEDRINHFRNTLKKRARKRINKGSNVRAELLYIDVLSQLEHIGDFSLNISQAIRQIH